MRTRKYSAREGGRSRSAADRENGKLCPFFGGIRGLIREKVLESILRRLCYNRFPDEFVFINPRTKRPYCDKTLNNIWNEACKVEGVGIELYNATRHSIASQASCEGAPLQAIKAVLGHTDIRTTLRYAMNDLSSQLIVFDKINKSLSTDINRHQTVSGGKDDNKF